MNSEEGKRLKLFRQKEGLSLSELGELVGKDKSQISKYESGALMVPIDVFKILHQKYDMSYDWFFEGSGRMKVNHSDKKKDLITNLTDLMAKNVALEAKVKNMELILKKLHADFHSTKK